MNTWALSAVVVLITLVCVAAGGWTLLVTSRISAGDHWTEKARALVPLRSFLAIELILLPALVYVTCRLTTTWTTAWTSLAIGVAATAGAWAATY